jgi:hypothetical protein
MKGGTDGAVIKPGDPANSLIVQKVAAGTIRAEPGRTEALKTWIASGASETGEGAAVTAPLLVPLRRLDGRHRRLLNAKCAMPCHTASGGPLQNVC